MYKATTRDDLKLLLGKVESLAKDIQSKLESGEDHLAQCNELSCNMVTVVFCLGEVYSQEQEKALKKTTPSKKTVMATKYNVRDAYGRFAKPTKINACYYTSSTP